MGGNGVDCDGGGERATNNGDDSGSERGIGDAVVQAVMVVAVG